MSIKKELRKYITEAKRVTIPSLQEKFSADYRTVRSVVDDMIAHGLLRYDAGLDFVVTDKAGEPASADVAEHHERREIPPYFAKRPLRNVPAAKEIFDGLYDGGRNDPDTLRAFLAYAEDDEDEDDDDDEFDDMLRKLGMTDLLQDDDDEDFIGDEEPEVEEIDDEDGEEAEEGSTESGGESDDAAIDALIEQLKAETDGAYERLTKQELALVLPVIERSATPFPPVTDNRGLVTYLCEEQRKDRDILTALWAVKNVYETVLSSKRVNAALCGIYAGYSSATFVFKAQTVADFAKMQKLVCHFGAGLFNHAGADERAEELMLKLIVPLPVKLRQPLSCPAFLKTAKYPRKHGVHVPIGKTFEGEDVFCDLSRRDLLVTGDRTTAADGFLHAAVSSLALRYPPEKLRVFFAAFRHADFVPFEQLPHSYTVSAVTTKDGLFRMFEVVKSLIGEEKREEQAPNILLFINGLPDMDEKEREKFCAALSEIAAKRGKVGVRIVLSADENESALSEDVIRLFGAKLCFRTGKRPSDLLEFWTLSYLPLCPASEMLVGGGDAYYLDGDTSVRLQAMDGASSADAIGRAAARFERPSARFAVAEPPAEITRPEPPSKLYTDALAEVVRTGNASVSFVQRTFQIGYNHAGKIIDWMESLGYISPFSGISPRSVFLTKEQFRDLYGDSE